MLTLENFRKKISPTILKRGRDYFHSERVIEIKEQKSFNSTIYEATVKGTRKYKVDVEIDESGEITETNCTCPYDYGEYCKHVAAVLYQIDGMTDKSKPASSSPQTTMLINTYEQSLLNRMEQENEKVRKVRLRPELMEGYNGTLEYGLQIGTNRMYKVRSIPQLLSDFQFECYISYGKFLAFSHSPEVLDEKSRKLLRLTSACYLNRSNYCDENSVDLEKSLFEEFFEMYRDDYIEFEGSLCLVKFEDPRIIFSLTGGKRKRYKLGIDRGYRFLGKWRHSCFYDAVHKTIMLASPEFTNVMCELYQTVYRTNELFIAESDMPEFYSAVLKNASLYSEIRGIELAEKYAPPEMIPQLYVDISDNGTVYANLMFNYGEKTYPAFAKIDCPHYDKIAESLAKSAVQKYLCISPGNTHHPLLIVGDEPTYSFIVNGINELSKIMELYISDKFRRMAVRPAIRPKLGIRPSGKLLELEISDENYSSEELAEVLSAYRTGAKYHRLKDGSFAIIDDSLSEFNELTESLNISNKDLIKSRLKIPAYRMLYLDSLQNKKAFIPITAKNLKKPSEAIVPQSGILMI